MQNSQKTTLEKAVEASRSSDEIKFAGTEDFYGLEEFYKDKKSSDKLSMAILESLDSK